MDIFAQSLYDAAHLYVVSAKNQKAAMMPWQVPVPTIATTLEVVADGKVFKVQGAPLDCQAARGTEGAEGRAVPSEAWVGVKRV